MSHAAPRNGFDVRTLDAAELLEADEQLLISICIVFSANMELITQWVVKLLLYVDSFNRVCVRLCYFCFVDNDDLAHLLNKKLAKQNAHIKGIYPFQ